MYILQLALKNDPVPQQALLNLCFTFYRPHSRGDNTFGSVRVCVRPFVRVCEFAVGTLLFELFDL